MIMKTFLKYNIIIMILIILPFINVYANNYFKHPGDRYGYMCCRYVNILMLRNININYNISTSLHGANLSIGFNYGTAKKALSFNILIDDGRNYFDGISFGYQYYVIPSIKKNNFYLFNENILRYKSLLSNQVNKILYPNNSCRDKYNKFYTFESYLGLGIGLRICKKLLFNFKFGIGGYYSKICSDCDLRCSNFKHIRPDSNFSVFTNFGLNFII